jgi:ATP-dependent RNA circularization protein (DNA/RNA ligase family)
MKKYTVSYNIGNYRYQSEVFTSSSGAAMLWAETIGGSNPYIVKEEEVE